MKPSSANFRHYLGSDGVRRKEWQVFCKCCDKESWIKSSKTKAANRELCSSCAWSRPLKKETKEKISRTLKDKYKHDPEFVLKVSLARNVPSGKGHWNWKGGATPLNQRTRTSRDSNAWKLAVLHRDEYRCRICKNKDNLEAHHINSWAEFPEDRFILENGLTLCKICHKNYHDYEREVKKNG